MNEFLHEAQNLSGDLTAIRRDLHRHPELGFHEVRTAGIVARELARLGLAVTTGVGETGVVGLLDSGRPGPVILVRVDMDALPVTEATGAEYASETPGVMHACGHDGHVAAGLAVARMLTGRKGSLQGKIKFMFQPAEEGLGGAMRMLEAGVLENPRPDFCLALHLWNEKPVGWLAVAPGPSMAGGDVFTVRLTGVGGHGALPQQAVDPVVAAAQIVSALQTIPSRNVSPLQAAVISVTMIQAGDAFNIIPPSALLRGTFRYFEPEVHQRIVDRFRQVVEGVGQAMGCQVEIDIREMTPAVVNDPGVAGRLQALAAREFPDIRVDGSFRTMVSEDMAYVMRQIPGTYFMVGSANPEKGLNYGHHHPRFDFDESALPLAAAFMAASAFDLAVGESAT